MPNASWMILLRQGRQHAFDEHRRALERELGKPVLANNAVSIWAGLRLLKTGDSIPGYGRLLRDHLTA